MLRALVSFLVVGLFGALFAGAYWIFVAQATPTAGGFGGPPGGFAVPVEAEEVSLDTAKKSVLAIGTLSSSQSVIIRSEVAGRIAELNLPEGQPVSQGAVLVQLDSSIERAAMRQARAGLELSRANFKRADELVKRGSGTARALDEARAGLKADEAAVASMEAQLERFKIYAPFSGVLGLKQVSVGDYLAPGAEIINLEQIDPLHVEFRVPEIFLSLVKVGNKVALAIDAYPDREFLGEVYAINPLVDAAGRSIVMRARVPNPTAELKPGLFARVTLDLVVKDGAIFVPEESIVPIGDARFVFKVVDGKAAFIPVTLGSRGRGMVEITEGLVAKDVVVTAGTLKIFDGAAVQPVPPAPPEGAKPAAEPASNKAPAAEPAPNQAPAVEG